MTHGKVLMITLWGTFGLCMHASGLALGQIIALSVLTLAIMLIYNQIQIAVYGKALEQLRATHAKLVEDSQRRVADLDQLRLTILARMEAEKAAHQD